MSYAQDTSVPVERSQREIETLLQKYGAKKFGRGYEEGRAVIWCELADRRLMFELRMPTAQELATDKQRSRGKLATPDQVAQAERARWRALALAIKAKFVAVESGVETFEEAFLAQIVVPHDGRAVRFSRVAIKAIQDAYTTGGNLPPLLPSGGAP